jgi:hypothetical protein
LPGQHGTVQTEVAGLCLVLALYILEIATFWPFIP